MTDAQLLALVKAATEQEIEQEADRLREKWKGCIPFDRSKELSGGVEKTPTEIDHLASGCVRCKTLIRFHERVANGENPLDTDE